MKKILIALFITLFFCTSAQAISVGFNVSGDGGTDGFYTINRLYLDGVDEADIAGNPSGAVFSDDHLWSFEDANGFFTESFTLDITSADLTGGGAYSASTLAAAYDANWDRYFVDVALEGQFIAGTAYFSSGAATMYIEKGTNKDYDGTDQMVAVLELNSNQTMVLDSTSVGEGVAGQIDMLFTYTASGHDFWDDATDALVGKQWLLSFFDGEIHVEEELFNMATTDYLEPTGWTHGQVVTGFGWNVNGLTADFTAIPEPATMFLLGSGLLSLVGIGRKRFFKKD